MTLTRRSTGAIVAATGVLLAFGSAYLSWYGGQSAPHLPIAQLVQALPDDDVSSYWRSLAAPLTVVGMVGALGAVLRSRVLLGLSWLTGVTTLVLWGLMRAIAKTTDRQDEVAVTGIAPWVCVAGTVLILVGIAVMGPRKEEIEAPLSMFDSDPPD